MDLLQFEQKYWNSNLEYVAGIDEAGRGPLAGPVVASAVIFPKDISLPEVTDSKKISEKKRERLFKDIYKNAISIGIGIVHENIIDEKNILQATYIAMRQAISNLSVQPNIILVDGKEADIKHYKQHSIINGDQKSISIAAASIIAKVTRDRLMYQYDIIFPDYDFAKHKGYGTKKHLETIGNKKACPIHRKSFNPISKHLPSFAYLKRNHLISNIGKQIMGTHLIKNGHHILNINHNISNMEEIDIISIYKEKMIFTNVDTLIDKKNFLLSDKNVISISSNRMIKLINKYLEEKDLEYNFYFNKNIVSLEKNNYKVDVAESHYSEISLNKIENKKK